MRSGLVMTSVERNVGALDNQRRLRSGNAADEGSAGTRTSAPCNSGFPDREILRPWLPSALGRYLPPKCLSIRSVWSRLASVPITVVIPGAASPASSTADLICAEATGVRYRTGSGSRAPIERQRQPPAAPLAPATRAPISSRGSSTRRIGLAAQRGVAVESRRDRAAGDRPHHQSAAGTGIAKIEWKPGAARKPTTPKPRAPTRQIPRSTPRRAQRPHRLGGIQHVFALAGRKCGFDRPPAPQNKGPMRNRFVAGNTDLPG